MSVTEAPTNLRIFLLFKNQKIKIIPKIKNSKDQETSKSNFHNISITLVQCTLMSGILTSTYTKIRYINIYVH